MNALAAFRGAILLAAALLALAAGAARAQATVEDPFQYLENPADPRSAGFHRVQAAHARETLDALPGRRALAERIHALTRGSIVVSSLTVAGPRLFYLRQSPGGTHPVLCMREGPAAPERELLDPERFSRPGEVAAIDWFSPSPDGRHVAYGVSLAGREDSVLRVLAVDARRDLPLEIDRARFNQNLAWHPDSRAFYYARIPEGNPPGRRDANVRVYRHVLGRESARDEIVFAAAAGGALEVPELAQPSLHVPLESRHAYAFVREGARRELAIYVAEQRDLAVAKPRWQRLVRFQDEVLDAIGWRDDLYLLSRRNAPRHRVLRMRASTLDIAGARPIVAEGDTVVEQMVLARDALYLRTMLGGVDRLERVGLGLLGPQRPEFVRIPFDHAITQMTAHPRQEGALLGLQGWIDAPVVVRVDRRGELAETPIQPKVVANYADIDEVRLYAPSHDGTRIPVTLLYRKGTRLTGDNPMLLTAYGSFGVPVRPAFDAARLAWLERGGVYAIAHVRGGGEYGAAWHEGGRHAAKVNTVLDFIAAAEFVSSYGFTRPSRLAVMGFGAGAIPAAGALVRKPALFSAAVLRSPLVDMLRAEHAPEGPANVPEFGSAHTAQGEQNLRAISAYHQVRPGTPYPAVLLTTGIHDPRVSPWHAAKMAARLQAAAPEGKPVLLRVDFEGGYGVRASRAQRNEELADIWSFVLWQMGEAQFQPPSPLLPWTPPRATAAEADASPR